MIDPLDILAKDDVTAGQAAYYLVSSLLGQLAANNIQSPDEMLRIAAMAAYAARGNGHAAAAELVEATIEGSAAIDFEAEAEALGIAISRRSTQ